MALSEDAATAPEGLWHEYLPEDRLALVEQAVDIRRAIIVFAGAGLDTAVKQLIRDAIPSLVEASDQAKRKFLEFTEDAFKRTDASGPRLLAEVLTSSDPRQALVERYVYRLTGSSLQSAEQLQGVAAALGVIDGLLRKRLTGLKPAFAARNQVVHELDLLDPSRHGAHSRRERQPEEVLALAHELLTCGQLLINSVAETLGSDGFYPTVWPQ